MTDSQTPSTAAATTAQDEVVDLCSELIRIDSLELRRRQRDRGSGPRRSTSRRARRGRASSRPSYETGERRANVVARIEGADRDRDALLDPRPPRRRPGERRGLAGRPRSPARSRDGCVWGRGAVDMKDMDAMTLAVVRQRLREGRKPPRDVVLAFLADEEAGGAHGAHWLVDERPDLFEGVTEADRRGRRLLPHGRPATRGST